MKKNEKTTQEIKERVRGTCLSATSGGRCWVRSYAAGVVGGVCVSSAGSTGTAGGVDGSAGCTGAAEVERDIDLESCTISFVVDFAVVPLSVPRANWEKVGRGDCADGIERIHRGGAKLRED